METNQTQHSAFVFRPMKQRLLILGLGGKEWLIVVLTAIMGAILAFMLGFWTHIDYVDRSKTEINNDTAALNQQQRALKSMESYQEGLIKGSNPTMPSEDVQNLAKLAQENGVTSSMNSGEISELVAKQELGSVPNIPDIPRWLIFFFVPTLVVAGFQAEVIHNSSIYKEGKRTLKNAMKQHNYYSNPAQYMKKYERKAI